MYLGQSKSSLKPHIIDIKLMVKDKNKKRIIIRKWADSFIWIKPEGMYDPTKISRLEAMNGREIEVAVELYMTL